MSKIKSLTVILSFALVGGAGVYAVPASPHKIVVNIDGGQTFIRMFGDEYCHWAETEDGYTVIQDDKNQWCYAVSNDTGDLMPSPYHLQVVPDPTTRLFLAGLDRKLRPANSHHQQARRNLSAPVRTAPSPAMGQRRMIIILMEYGDRPFTKTQADFDRLFNEEGYRYDGARGSVRDFYLAASYGQLQLSCDVFGPYTAKNNMAYYGRNSGNNSSPNAYNLFREAITFAANDTDLKQYDGDGDGYIDNVHIIFAGYGEEYGAEADAIWSHESTFTRPYTIQGMKIDRYSCSPELRGNSGSGISRIGVHCHEIGHALGAMDFYDTDYEDGGAFEGTGKWDVMGAGNHNNDGVLPADFNPYVKAFNFGWIKPTALPAGEVTMLPSNDSPDSYYILQEEQGEDFYLLENRCRTGWGMGLPGAGLLIYHVHQDIEKAGNSINASHPQTCYVVCASSRSSLPDNTPESYGGEGRINSTGCPFPGFAWNTAFNSTTTPAAFWWSGKPCGIDLSNIALHSDNTITLQNNSNGNMIEPVINEEEQLFSEDFEGETTQMEGHQFWRIANSASVLAPYRGKGFFLLSAQDEYLQSIEDAFEFTVDSVPAGALLTVRGQLASEGLRGRTNTLRIGYRMEEDEYWTQSVITSEENGEWTAFSLTLPNGVSPHVRIEGVAVPLSLIAIDNIEVISSRRSVDDGINPVIVNNEADCRNDETFFSLAGHKINNPKRGVNIIRSQDGKVRKRFK